MTNKYAVLVRTTGMQLAAENVAAAEDETENTQNYTVAAGTLIKLALDPQTTIETPSIEAPTAVNLQPPATISNVYVYDAVLREPDTTRTYRCEAESLLPVSNDLWPYIVAIPEPQRRLQLLLNKERCDWVSEAVPGEFVTVPGRCLEVSDGNMRYDCAICYIGPVPEIHPVGYFFGLRMLNVATSPQAPHVPFTRKYFECDPKNAIFTTADRIIETPPYAATPSSTEAVSVDEEQEEARNDWSIYSFYNYARDKIRSTLPL